MLRSLKRYRYWILGVGLLSIISAVASGYLLIPMAAENGRISQATCDKIQIGWTYRQVYDFIGRNDDDLTFPRVNGNGLGFDGNLWTAQWIDEDGAEIYVTFEARSVNMWGFVKGKRYVPSNLSVFELMKRRIERRIKALWQRRPSPVEVVAIRE